MSRYEAEGHFHFMPQAQNGNEKLRIKNFGYGRAGVVRSETSRAPPPTDQNDTASFSSDGFWAIRIAPTVNY